MKLGLVIVSFLVCADASGQEGPSDTLDLSDIAQISHSVGIIESNAMLLLFIAMKNGGEEHSVAYVQSRIERCEPLIRQLSALADNESHMTQLDSVYSSVGYQSGTEMMSMADQILAAVSLYNDALRGIVSYQSGTLPVVE